MPWTTLGLDPAGATERDVKRAYAKLLKTCRPDQDAEGFSTLHEAYQTALFELQWRNADEGVESSEHANAVEMPQALAVEELDDRAVATDPEPPPTRQAWAEEATAVEMSPGLRAITGGFDRLESALASGADEIPSLVSQVEALLYEHPSEVHCWGGFMHELFARHGDHPALGIKPDTILFELEHGGAAASLAVIDRLDRRGSTQGITNLASLLLQNKARIPTPAAGIAAARLAGAAAFWARGSAERLADFAYEHLARGERDFHMQLIDRHAGMAQMMALVPVPLKSFWRQRLMHTAGRDSWDDEESKAALDWLKTPLARSGPCFEVFVGLLPEELAKAAKATPEKWQPYVSSWSTSGSSCEPATQGGSGWPEVHIVAESSGEPELRGCGRVGAGRSGVEGQEEGTLSCTGIGHASPRLGVGAHRGVRAEDRVGRRIVGQSPIFLACSWSEPRCTGFAGAIRSGNATPDQGRRREVPPPQGRTRPDEWPHSRGNFR